MTPPKASVSPYAVGLVVGLLIAAGIFIVVVYFPWLVAEKNRWWGDFVFFTVFLFFVVLSRNWRFHKEPKFWLIIVLSALVHTTVVLPFTRYVHRLAVLPYATVMFLEIVAIELILISSCETDGQRDT